MLIFKQNNKGNLDMKSFNETMQSIQNNFNTLEDKYKELTKAIQVLCKHENGFKFSYTTDELRYFRPSRKCEICGLMEIYENTDDYWKAKLEQEYKNAKKTVENYEKDNNVVQEK